MSKKLVAAVGVIGSAVSIMGWLSANGSLVDLIIAALVILLIIELRTQPKTARQAHNPQTANC